MAPTEVGELPNQTVTPDALPCDHGVEFNVEECACLTPHQVRNRFPRLDGQCPKGCGYCGIYYFSYEHQIYGDW